MLNRFIDALGVVDHNVADPLAGRSHIQENGGHSAAHELIDKMLLHFRSHHGHALDLAFQHSPDT